MPEPHIIFHGETVEMSVQISMPNCDFDDDWDDGEAWEERRVELLPEMMQRFTTASTREYYWSRMRDIERKLEVASSEEEKGGSRPARRQKVWAVSKTSSANNRVPDHR